MFAIGKTGKESVVHLFGGSGDGANPYAGLLNVKGTLYGTTFDGGTNKFGTVFATTTSGAESVLYSFGALGGDYPEAGLIDVKGTLYGTTADGGTNSVGVVFAITKSGAESVPHNFAGGSGDGAVPYAGLLDVKGTLYGTTEYGGANNAGTVYAITTSGTTSVVHSFGGPGDGGYPLAALINVGGTLYGTTVTGGASCGSYHITGCGVVFAIAPSGAESVLHSFGGSGDGVYPYGGLVNVKGTLYGTAEAGGANCSPFGCGVIFSLTRSGTETVLHNFGASGDGEYPGATLLNVKGTLYGTTVDGGKNDDGTVFSLKSNP
ncbi:MAG TPA: choice-of-anchor tandem repeat GloVer-containing protein [Candidatus Cybelea sp.]|nr:choice-of-anchor tandem repeat GloVer-containing protein [Candidatus Cybelea sp.]